MKIRIYTVTHKKYRFPKEKMYKPIIAGAFEYDKNDFPESYIRDDSGNNISFKHDAYSEFTALYWIWKNSSADIVGLNHYRRYFIKGGWGRYLLSILNPKKNLEKDILKKNDVGALFKEGYDCILPKKQWRVKRTLRKEFDDAYGTELLNAAESVIKIFFPEYYDVFCNIFNGHENFQKCICIMKRNRFDQYASWMFSVLEKLEQRGFGKKERELAFLGERLMNVWVEYERKYNGLKVKELFYINTETKISTLYDNYTEYHVPILFKPFFLFLMNVGIWRE